MHSDTSIVSDTTKRNQILRRSSYVQREIQEFVDKIVISFCESNTRGARESYRRSI